MKSCVFVHAQWILPGAPASAAMRSISWSRLKKTFPAVAPGPPWTRPGNIGQRVLSTTPLLTAWCKGSLICVREALYGPVYTRRKGLLRREPYTLLLHLKAVGDEQHRVRYVVSGTSTGACTPALSATTALGISGSFLTGS